MFLGLLDWFCDFRLNLVPLFFNRFMLEFWLRIDNSSCFCFFWSSSGGTAGSSSSDSKFGNTCFSSLVMSPSFLWLLLNNSLSSIYCNRFCYFYSRIYSVTFEHLGGDEAISYLLWSTFWIKFWFIMSCRKAGATSPWLWSGTYLDNLLFRTCTLVCLMTYLAKIEGIYWFTLMRSMNCPKIFACGFSCLLLSRSVYLTGGPTLLLNCSKDLNRLLAFSCI